MRWCRAKRLFGGCFALFALAVQLAVSFAHIHPQDLSPKQELRVAAKAPSWTVLADGATLFGKRSNDSGRGLPHDDCAICASISLISSALTTHAPALSLPARFTLIQLQFFGDFEFQPVRYSSFRTRAPPTA